MINHENRLISIEMALTDCQKTIEELDEVVIAQGKMIDVLKAQNKKIMESLSQPGVKSAEEEAPPPHY